MFRFPTKLSIVLVTVGSATALAGGAFALKIFLQPGGGWTKIGAALAVAVGGLLVIACGEIIGVAFALEEGIQGIEETTRRTADLLDRHLAREERTSETVLRRRVGRI